QLVAPALHDYVVPITLGILVALFAVQRHGTAAVGAVFGPLTLVWFTVLALMGLRGILIAPQVLQALDPRYAVRFFTINGVEGYLVLYAVFLVTTGAEALYADLGHFGKKPIRQVWFVLVLPALLLNYFGQGAILLAEPSAVVQPFFHLAPQWALLPLVVLATAATCIASQAVITGAYSLTRQAMQLGLFPPLTVEQTAAEAHGQIYMPAVNWILMAAAIGLVLAFRSSGNLAAAYGVAVNSTMVITTVLAFNVARERGGWSLSAALTFLGLFMLIDLGFLGSNLMTIPDGGWLPLAIGAALFTVMVTWRRGTALVQDQIARITPTLETLIGRVKGEQIPRAPGTAVFLAGTFDHVPPSLPKLIRHSGIVFERVIVLRVVFEPVPTTHRNERIELSDVGDGFFRIVLHYGFMQTPNIPSALGQCAELGLVLDLDQIHYVDSSLVLLAGRRRDGMVMWRDILFAFLTRNTQDATAAYHIPIDRLVTVGQRVGI
ncbi:MAG: KUP/HAK/KT family potassium transporter, partial [Rhodoferax sp.]